MNLDQYKSFFFDCDGVLVDSNGLKSNAFYKAVEPYGKEEAQALLDYHLSNGGVSRVPKFTYYLENILHDYDLKPTIDELIGRYEKVVKEGLFDCRHTQALSGIRNRAPEAMFAVVSGGQENEVRDVLSFKGLDSYFDGGIFGSPRDKVAIIEREFGEYGDSSLYVGDSEYDFHVARNFGMDFIFVSGWTGMAGWEDFCLKNQIKVIETLEDL